MRASGALYRALALGQGPGAVDEMSTDELTLGTSLVQGQGGAAVAEQAAPPPGPRDDEAAPLQVAADHP
jgi:hypothetical protein